MLKAGLAGCGAIARVHAAVLRALPEVKLCACCDIVREKAEDLAREDGCAVYDDYTAMLDREKPDTVHLCVPHYLHVPMAEEAAARGIAVFTEKPPAIDRAQWARLRKTADHVPVGVCFQNRYNRNVQAVREMIADGRFGALVGARAFVTWRRDEAYYRNSSWRGRLATEGGGALINQAIHTLDLLVWIMGHPDRAEGMLQNHHLPGLIEVEDTAAIRMLLGGKTALLYATTAYAVDAPVIIEFQTEKAALRLEGNSLDIITPEGTEHRTYEMPEALGKGYWGNGHMLCIADFYRSLKEKSAYQNDIKSVADTMEVLLQIYESIRSVAGD